MQSPQFAGSASTAFSQPLSLLESQSRHSPLHFGSHALLRQLLVVTCAARLTSHSFPQPPQLVRDVLVSVSQPLNLFVSHVSQGAMQLGVHALDEHELLVTWAGAVSSQILPQPLQLALSVAVLVVQPFCGLLAREVGPEARWQTGARVAARAAGIGRGAGGRAHAAVVLVGLQVGFAAITQVGVAVLVVGGAGVEGAAACLAV